LYLIGRCGFIYKAGRKPYLEEFCALVTVLTVQLGEH
jgi:hypothetical protein